MLSILHLSDFHIGQAARQTRLEQATGGLLADIEKHFSTLEPPHLLITGDLTNMGSADQYAEFKQMLTQIRQDSPWLTTAPLLAVPGNHDLIRPPASANFSELALADPDKHASKTASEKPDGENRLQLAEMFAPYSNFMEAETSSLTNFRRGLLPGDFSWTTTSGPCEVAFVGLNSTFVQVSDDFNEGMCAITEAQLDEIFRGNPFKSCCSLILLTHQPPSWLTSQSTKLLSEYVGQLPFTMHVYGHMHVPSVETRLLGADGRPRTTLQAPSFFGIEHLRDGTTERLVGYQVIQLDIARRRARLAPRAWQWRPAGGGHFVSDPSGRVELEASGPWTRWFEVDTNCSHRITPSPTLTRRPIFSANPTHVRMLQERAQQSTGILGPEWRNVATLIEEASVQEITSYFDGRSPTWGDLSTGKVPTRSHVAEVATKILNHPGSTHLVALIDGAGSEGKSTFLMQVAMALISEGRSVFELDTAVDADAVDWDAALSRRKAVYIIDDAAPYARALHQAMGHAHNGNASFLLASRNSDWQDLGLYAQSWQRRAEFFSESLGGLDDREAREIVRAWQDNGVGLGDLEGVDESERPTRLMRAISSVSGDGALLGGMLEVRYGPRLNDRVREILSRLIVRVTPQGIRLSHALVFIAAADFLSLPLDADILATALKIPSEHVVSDVVLPLQGEAVVAGGHHAIRGRHIRISKEILSVATNFGLDVGDVYVSLIRATLTLGQRKYIAGYPKYLSAPRTLFLDYPNAALAAATYITNEKPGELTYAIDKMHILRRMNENDEARKFGEWTIARDTGNRNLKSGTLRAFYAEMGSVCQQLADFPAGALYYLRSLADEGRYEDISQKQVEMSTCGLLECLHELELPGFSELASGFAALHVEARAVARIRRVLGGSDMAPSDETQFMKAILDVANTLETRSSPTGRRTLTFRSLRSWLGLTPDVAY